MSMLDNDKRWEHLYKLTGRSSTMASPNFVPGDMVRKHQGWRHARDYLFAPTRVCHRLLNCCMR